MPETKAKAFDYARSTYFFIKLGLANYIGILMSLVESTLIIYNFGITKFLGANHPLNFFVFLAACIISSFLIGFLVTKSFFKKDQNSFYGKEMEISSRINPFINIPLGKIAAVSYDSSIASTKATMEICKKLDIPTTELSEALLKLEDMRAKTVLPK